MWAASNSIIGFHPDDIINLLLRKAGSCIKGKRVYFEHC